MLTTTKRKIYFTVAFVFLVVYIIATYEGIVDILYLAFITVSYFRLLYVQEL